MVGSQKLSVESTGTATLPPARTEQGSPTKILVCLPCFNCEATIVESVRSILDNSDADVLIVDDHSDHPLDEYLQEPFGGEPRIVVIRPEEKVFAGGARNLGLQRSIEQAYDVAVMMDSDIILRPESLIRMVDYLRSHPDRMVVGSAITPFGNFLQFSDTLINFSKYLPDDSSEVSWNDCLAGYAFAINMAVYRRSPCQMPCAIGGEDVVFFQRLQQHCGVERFPLLNMAPVIHKPPRDTLDRAIRAQHRYGRSYFSHNHESRNQLFNKVPMLHLLTPRFVLMILRLLCRRRFLDFRYLPVCWYLDFRRALKILRLHLSGFQYPQYRPNGTLIGTPS